MGYLTITGGSIMGRSSSLRKNPNTAALLLAVIITLAFPKWLYGWSSVYAQVPEGFKRIK
jgi:hypothetical protein